MKNLFLLFVEITLVASMHYAKYSRENKPSAPRALLVKVGQEKRQLTGKPNNQHVYEQEKGF